MNLLTKLSTTIGLGCLLFGSASAQTVSSDSWAATDALGRHVRDYNTAGDKRPDKFVAIFYWTWHQGNDDTTYKVRNIAEILHNHPEAIRDNNNPAWGPKQPGFFFWEQPLLGYYKTTDPWVLRKHAEMLADAGVDAVFFDCTNGSITWDESFEALLKSWDQAQKDGVNVPKVAFMLPFGPAPHSLVSLRHLYEVLYKPGRYENLWFVWKGKPCIMGYPDNLTDTEEDKAIAQFFTFRPGQPDYVDGPNPNFKNQWSWLEVYPQHGYVKGPNGKFEQVSVGVAQNTSPDRKGHCGAFNVKDAYGRNFSVLKGFDPRIDGYLYGRNFEEQWSRAFELDPELVFVTGWNEYIAGMWHDPWNGFPFSFVDQYNWNCSRDIEPNKGWGDKGDVYYYQLVDNIRKFKGLDAPQKVSEPTSIKIGKATGWDQVAPTFAHYKGNTLHRDHRGRYDQYYTNNTGRNDIYQAKVARDGKNLYFLVETADKLTPSSDRNWMLLFIDIDRDKTTGWNGYDFVVNRLNPKSKTIFIERCVGNHWEWSEVGTGKMAVSGNKLELQIPEQLFGLSGTDADFEFKWSDNMQENGNIMDFYVNGDVAPGGRFNFVY